MEDIILVGGQARRGDQSCQVRHHEVGLGICWRRRPETSLIGPPVEPDRVQPHLLSGHVVVEEALGDVQELPALDYHAPKGYLEGVREGL